MRTLLRFASTALFSAFLSFGAPASAEPPADSLTPPRLGLIDGQVSYWRTGAPDWVAARLNTPLAAGDTLYAAAGASFELQIGSQAYLRGGSEAEIALVEHDPDFLQFKVTSGQAAFDLRTLAAGATVEIDTPNAAFTVTHSGYYRLDVDADSTRFITRRGGSADITSANGEYQHIGEAQELEIDGNTGAIMLSRAAPPLDMWDRWNFARSDAQLDSISARYVPAGVYGTDSLDRYGAWQQQPDYGAVWMPSGMPDNWAPYSDGSWVLDPYYGWSWIDAAPWGWAPFHYGRWVRFNQHWAWAPGPRVIRPVYSPALVAFFGYGEDGSRVAISVGSPAPAVSWVALGWGEPVVPWWGGRNFIGKPHWAGWGGPRVINNVVIHNTSVVNITNIHYQNTRVSDAVLGVPAGRFGHGAIRPEPLRRGQLDALKPLHGALPIQPTAVSVVAGGVRTAPPPRAASERPVVNVRRPERNPVSQPERRIQQQPGMPAASPFGAPARQTMPDTQRGGPGNRSRLPDNSAPGMRPFPRALPAAPASMERSRPIEAQHDIQQKGVEQPGNPPPAPGRFDAPPRRFKPTIPDAPRPPAAQAVPVPSAREPLPAVPPPPHTFGRPRVDPPQSGPNLPAAMAPASRPTPPQTRIERFESSPVVPPPARINQPLPRPEGLHPPTTTLPARQEIASPAPRPSEPRPFESRPHTPDMRPAEPASPPPAARAVPAPSAQDKREVKGHANQHDENRTDRP